MENIKNRKVYLFTVIAWLLFMFLHGWSYTYGLFSVQMLGLTLLFEAWAIEKPGQLIKQHILRHAPYIQRWALERIAPGHDEMMKMKKVLNVGGNSKDIPLPAEYAEFEHLLLDIDPRGSPDIVCDARELTKLDPEQFDAIYCSHNLEHYYRHDVQKVLAGFLHVLKDGGFVHIRVPDIQEVMRLTIEKNLDIDDILYQSPAGPIMVLDVLYGYSMEIEQSGQDFFAHKTGFTQKSLVMALQKAAFSKIYNGTENLEVFALAFKGLPDRTTLTLFNLDSD